MDELDQILDYSELDEATRLLKTSERYRRMSKLARRFRRKTVGGEIIRYLQFTDQLANQKYLSQSARRQGWYELMPEGVMLPLFTGLVLTVIGVVYVTWLDKNPDLATMANLRMSGLLMTAGVPILLVALIWCVCSRRLQD